ncbi:TrkH-domain-containing protein [Coprinopsis marcescibilis]|uniref:Potassium transport protein n=1 Tax=Coprinopsis marcescibilis TaxID=230819 RepID=A0A5C3KRD2_COPMA|nr:TrkH-domain-containing protein [Coprinopsis marcescibilis]
MMPEGEHTTNDRRGIWNRLSKHLNFYRIHILFFTFTPLFFSIIFYLSNGEVKISYIDSLFNCVSAMAVCGLASVDLSSLTPWQQVILFIQMCIGSPIVVSWFVVFIRKRYIQKRSTHVAEYLRQKKLAEEAKGSTFLRFLRSIGITSPNGSLSSNSDAGDNLAKQVDVSMIRRLEVDPQIINPSGHITNESRVRVTPPSAEGTPSHTPALSRQVSSNSSREHDSSEKAGELFNLASTNGVGLPRTTTIEFADLPRPNARHRIPHVGDEIQEEFEDSTDRVSHNNFPRVPTHVSFQHTPTVYSTRTGYTHNSQATTTRSHGRKHQGFGGFPMPFGLIQSLLERMFPSLKRRLHRTLTIPATTSLVSTPTNQVGAKYASYVKGPIRVRRNSNFQDGSPIVLQDLACIEYEAVSLLLKIIFVYHFAVQVVAFVAITPYISTDEWRYAFEVPQLVKPVNSVWFSAFQVVSAYTNTGTSLVDQSMLPFQSAYLMVLFMVFLVFAGNTCFPIFLRLSIWVMSKVARKDSPKRRILDFLLDHPRRCYLYLFPSHQTWFLLTVVFALTVVDWTFFLVLDIGNEVIQSIPVNIRVMDGLMQAVAVRAAGFAIVPLAALAPAVKVLYTIMMYISVYPIAMSVRSTNVYEETSLGIFPEDDEDQEETFDNQGSRMTVWSRYLAMHVRQQLAFDMWWMGLALFLVCIIERSKIDDPLTISSINIFTILFELVSAYGTVGLSLGLATANYSLSGAFSPLSKLIVCLVMIRGRHRGLPVAIDRAVLVPKEYKTNPDSDSASQHTTYTTHTTPGAEP